MRGTVSTLWASTSGRLSKTSRSRSGSPLKSGIRFSTPVPGFSSWICSHRLGVQPGATVGQVVAGDAGDGRVAQLHLLHRLRHPARLVAVERLRLAGVDLAEVAASGALVAADEEGRLAVLPALEDVGAAGLLAHGVQSLGLHQALEVLVLRAHPRARLDPLRLALDRGLCVAHLEAEQLASLWCVSLSHAGHCTSERLLTSNRRNRLRRLLGHTSRRRNHSSEMTTATTSRTPRKVPDSRWVIIWVELHAAARRSSTMLASK